jgi:GT2 family glycosyltransferase
MNMPDVSFVIPTNRDAVYTTKSIPSIYSVFVEREGNLDEARNRGIRKANTEIIIVCDDDIEFNKTFLDSVLSKMETRTLIGLEDFYPMRWCIGRFLCFWKKDWETIGGFDENRSIYGGDDTDFCIRMENAGVKIVRIPRESVKHFHQEKVRPPLDELNSLWYLFRRHPKEIVIPAFKVIISKITGKRV